ncbi:MAG TPA: zf-HC2 domain-containing protein [Nocardioidaceae bacterium]|nr:zf-HC2 domain-containing protein [Nocardioidaceae bacterium]
MTCMQTVSLGAYVLGALDASERLETEEHLRDCAQCRDELVRLAPLPGLLGQVSLDDVLAPEPPMRPADATPPAKPAPHRRRIIATVAASALLLVGVGLAGRVVVDDGSTTAATTWSTPVDASGIDATAQLADRGWGTDIELTMDDLPAHARCRLVVIGSDGRVETAGWWTTGYAAEADVPASTSIESDAIDRMEIRTGSRVLAVLQPTDTAT